MDIRTIIGVALFGLGLWLSHSTKKYEFHNRTDGGVVRFKSYSASRLHSAKARLGRPLLLVGVLLILMSFAS